MDRGSQESAKEGHLLSNRKPHSVAPPPSWSKCREVALDDADIEPLSKSVAEHTPLASHIFVFRRHSQTVSNIKSGKRHHLSARLSWQQACDLGFRGDLEKWERLLGAAPARLDVRFHFGDMFLHPRVRDCCHLNQWEFDSLGTPA